MPLPKHFSNKKYRISMDEPINNLGKTIQIKQMTLKED